MSKRIPHHRLNEKDQRLLEQQVNKEIKKYSEDQLFLPGEYRKMRYKGFGENDIEYDHCYVWR